MATIVGVESAQVLLRCQRGRVREGSEKVRSSLIGINVIDDE
jgi:hypothetical protein